jgi:LacI family transcriptional regulator
MTNASVLVLMELYDHRIRQGIGRYAAEHGWHLTFCDGCTHGGTGPLPQGWSGDGVLVQLNRRADFIRYIRRQRVPCVDLSIFRPDIRLPRITGDQLLIGQTAADHLLERGYRQAAYFSTEYENLHKLRHEGFADHFSEQSGNRPKNLAWELHSRKGIDNWRAQKAWLKRALQSLPKPLGVFCYSDYDAAKVETICLEAGYNIPSDIAVLGVDNDPLVCENIQIPLSSVRHDLFRIGYDGAALLDGLMHGEKTPNDPILIPPCGVESRASTDGFVASDPLVRSVIKFFRENLGRDIGVADAAEAASLPIHKLKTHFRSALGETVYGTLTRLRLFQAKRLLAQSDLSVKEIASATGFCHAQHLNNAFRRSEHCTPTAYRSRERAHQIVAHGVLIPLSTQTARSRLKEQPQFISSSSR